MELYSVTDSTFSQALGKDYDLAIFASGYEERCTNVAPQFKRHSAQSALLFGFHEHSDSEQRAINRSILESVTGTKEILSPAYSDSIIMNSIRSEISMMNFSSERFRVLVDYSSMSRFWYAAILNFFLYSKIADEVDITFTYSVGEHQGFSDLTPIHESNVVIEDILCVPGHEGSSTRLRHTVALFGLGFEWALPVGVVERIEPDLLFSFIAEPGAFPEYPSIARNQNAEFIRDYVKDRVYAFPLRSVDTTYRRLAELILPYLKGSNIIAVPMGPKPHVLASLLLACKFSELAVLHASARRSSPERVRSADSLDVVVTDVVLRKEEF